MDPTQQEGQNPDNVGAGRQAIFTPPPPEPTTPDTNSGDANAQPTPSVNLAHPYFSNHPTQTSATETGDIILNSNSPKPKHNKRPFIIGGVILAVLLVIITIILLVASSVSKPSIDKVSDDFMAYRAYMIYGPDGDEDDEWFFPQLADNLYIDDQQIEFVSTATALLDTFDKSFSSSRLNSNSDLRQEVQLSEQLYYGMVGYINREINLKAFYQVYLDSGLNTAKDKISSYFTESSNTGVLNAMSTELRKYYETEVELYRIYDEQGCVEDGVVSGICVQDIRSTQNYRQLKSAELRAEQLLPQIYRELTSEFQDTINNIESELANEQK